MTELLSGVLLALLIALWMSSLRNSVAIAVTILANVIALIWLPFLGLVALAIWITLGILYLLLWLVWAGPKWAGHPRPRPSIADQVAVERLQRSPTRSHPPAAA